MKSSRSVVLILVLGAMVLGGPAGQGVVPKPVSDCNLDEISSSIAPVSGTGQMMHCWNR
jgi:hypothetical protein